MPGLQMEWGGGGEIGQLVWSHRGLHFSSPGLCEQEARIPGHHLAQMGVTCRNHSLTSMLLSTQGTRPLQKMSQARERVRNGK